MHFFFLDLTPQFKVHDKRIKSRDREFYLSSLVAVLNLWLVYASLLKVFWQQQQTQKMQKTELYHHHSAHHHQYSPYHHAYYSAAVAASVVAPPESPNSSSKIAQVNTRVDFTLLKLSVFFSVIFPFFSRNLINLFIN
jgi:hypothetical protein